jgi:hypothetical protein
MYHMQVTTAMLADAARVENGKVYVHGGGWDTINASSFPTTHPSLALVLVLRVEYTEALEDIPFAIELVHEDGSLMGPRGEGTLNVGHPPGTKRGTPTFVPQAITFNLLQFESPGGYRFRISSGEQELASVPFRLVAQRQPSTKQRPHV